MARLAKLEYERQAGKLLRADQVQNALAIIMRDARDRLLALPDRLAEAVAVETNPAEVRHLLSREVRDTLLELGSNVPPGGARAYCSRSSPWPQLRAIASRAGTLPGPAG
jgi:hypothetical protein